MSLYNTTYASIINTLATSIYNKINSKMKAVAADTVFRTTTSSFGLLEYKYPEGANTTATSTAVPETVTTEKIGNAYSIPTAATIESDIKTFIKNTLGFTDTTLSSKPNGSDMLAFVFALNYYLENTLAKIATNPTTTTIVYKAITSGHANKITLSLDDESKANRITATTINEMYSALNNIGDAKNTGFPLTIKSTTTSSSSSSSSSSSCSSSCSSSSSSSSSRFIAYFNLN